MESNCELFKYLKDFLFFILEDLLPQDGGDCNKNENSNDLVDLVKKIEDAIPSMNIVAADA